MLNHFVVIYLNLSLGFHFSSYSFVLFPQIAFSQSLCSIKKLKIYFTLLNICNLIFIIFEAAKSNPMKKQFLLIISIFFFFQLNAQLKKTDAPIKQISIESGKSYYPFPDSNAIWNIVGDNIFTSNKFRIRYGLYGDTIINSQTYHKIYNLIDTNLIHQNSNYFAALRNDNKKVFIKFQGYSETLLYDFSLSVGDTIMYEIGGYASQNGFIPTGLESHWKTVSSIDSVLIETGQYRKRWKFNHTETWIEGIGNVDFLGLFSPIVTNLATNGDQFYFACFKQNNRVLFLNNPHCSTCFCQFLTGIDDNNSIVENTINLFPNPTSGKVTIDFEKTSKEVDITVRNTLGQTVLIKSYKTTNQLSFEINGAKGIYFVEIRTEDGKSVVVKVVKE